MTDLQTYIVEYRHWDYMDDDAYVVTRVTRATSCHEAIGNAWPFIKDLVESYGGTIDDLDAWAHEVPVAIERLRVAKAIYVAANGSPPESWSTLQKEKQNHYIQAAEAALEVLG